MGVLATTDAHYFPVKWMAKSVAREDVGMRACATTTVTTTTQADSIDSIRASAKSQ